MGRVLSNGGYHNGRAYPAMDNLAAAYAELGDYRSAWELQEDAIEMSAVDSSQREEFEAHLVSYLARQSWRDFPGEASPD